MTAAARLRHLEHMVQVLKAQMRREESAGTDATASSRGISPVPSSLSSGALSQETQPDAESTATTKGTAGAMADQTRYVESLHWEAVLDEVGISGLCLGNVSALTLPYPDYHLDQEPQSFG